MVIPTAIPQSLDRWNLARSNRHAFFSCTPPRAACPSLAVVDDDAAMGLALDEARAAALHGDVPIGAVVLVDGEVVARRHNERELLGDPTAHAEILALRDAAAARGSWRLDDAVLVVTLEPCPMCAGAAVNARLRRVVYGARDLNAGALGSLYHLGADPRLNHELAVTHDVRPDECASLLTEFFASRR
jgi:tRNA(adenine34) deaminase